jgi:hypothetical protein
VPSSGGVVDLLRNRPGAWLAAEISASALAESLLAALQLLHPEQLLSCPDSLSHTLTNQAYPCDK